MSSFKDLIDVTNIYKEKALEVHRKSLAVTRGLTNELNQIDHLRKAAQQDSETIGARQILGADGLWQGWLLRKRADLLQQMAMAKAREAHSLQTARTAFARAGAAQELQDEETAKKRQRRTQREAEILDELNILLRTSRKI
ncbi:MAG: hypothetical protein N4A61_01870 [Pelagimonas sp.]|nr:hypothetical protein [Pelagimonas sp.]